MTCKKWVTLKFCLFRGHHKPQRFMLFARHRTGLVNRNTIEGNGWVDKKKFAFYKC